MRLIKLIGDAAMLVCRETDPLLAALCKLVSAVEDEADLPTLRAGLARGGAFRHAGDWYGGPFNLASRVTGVAPSQAVLATREVCDAAGDEFAFELWDDVALKGIELPVRLYRVAAAR